MSRVRSALDWFNIVINPLVIWVIWHTDNVPLLRFMALLWAIFSATDAIAEKLGNWAEGKS